MNDRTDTEGDNNQHQHVAVYAQAGLDLEERRQRDAEQNQRETDGDGGRGSASISCFLLLGVKNCNVGVILHERGVIHAGRDKKTQVGDDKRERRGDNDTVHMHDLVNEDGHGSAQDDEHDAQRDLARERDHVLFVAAHIGNGASGNLEGGRMRADVGARRFYGTVVAGEHAARGFVRIGSRDIGHRRGARIRCGPSLAMRSIFAARHVTLHKVVERTAEKLADLDELAHLGVGLLDLSFGHALAGDAEQHGELLLGHMMLRAQILQVGAEAHGGPSRLSKAQGEQHSAAGIGHLVFLRWRLQHYGSLTVGATNLELHFKKI